MYLLYNFSILLFTAAIRLAAIFNGKAQKWVTGRRDWRNNLTNALRHAPQGPTLWMHVSSLGEFEQGRPIIEGFREQFPHWRVVLTFFSPSGYEIRKNYPLADVVAYLPADLPGNARDFMALVQPDAAIFVKYDFWANHLFELKKRGTPTLLVSALFRPDQPFFRWYGGLWRQMLACFTHVFVQNNDSKILLEKAGFQAVSVAGDTRVDRVLRLAAEVKPNPVVETYAAHSRVFIAGSTWEADEVMLAQVLQSPGFRHYKLVIAPHDPAEKNVARICSLFGAAVKYSQWNTSDQSGCRVLVIDNVGMLNSLYQYGEAAYIGGGLGKGIHNTLEPAAFGLPIFFGPKYEKFEEARQFVARGGAFPVRGADALTAALLQLQDPAFYQRARAAVTGYLDNSKGATTLALEWLQSRFPRL